MIEGRAMSHQPLSKPLTLSPSSPTGPDRRRSPRVKVQRKHDGNNDDNAPPPLKSSSASPPSSARSSIISSSTNSRTRTAINKNQASNSKKIVANCITGSNDTNATSTKRNSIRKVSLDPSEIDSHSHPSKVNRLKSVNDEENKESAVSSSNTVRDQHSLGILASRFYQLLLSQGPDNNYAISLTDALHELQKMEKAATAELLAATNDANNDDNSQMRLKRRIYDVVNILEGIGLVRKTTAAEVIDGQSKKDRRRKLNMAASRSPVFQLILGNHGSGDHNNSNCSMQSNGCQDDDTKTEEDHAQKKRILHHQQTEERNMRYLKYYQNKQMQDETFLDYWINRLQYEKTNMIEGARLLQQSPTNGVVTSGTNSSPTTLASPNGKAAAMSLFNLHNDCSKNKEEVDLPRTVHGGTDLSKLFLSPSDLVELDGISADDDAVDQTIVLSRPPGSVLHLPHKLEQRDQHYKFSILPPTPTKFKKNEGFINDNHSDANRVQTFVLAKDSEAKACLCPVALPTKNVAQQQNRKSILAQQHRYASANNISTKEAVVPQQLDSLIQVLSDNAPPRATPLSERSFVDQRDVQQKQQGISAEFMMEGRDKSLRKRNNSYHSSHTRPYTNFANSIEPTSDGNSVVVDSDKENAINGHRKRSSSYTSKNFDRSKKRRTSRETKRILDDDTNDDKDSEDESKEITLKCLCYEMGIDWYVGRNPGARVRDLLRKHNVNKNDGHKFWKWNQDDPQLRQIKRLLRSLQSDEKEDSHVEDEEERDNSGSETDESEVDTTEADDDTFDTRDTYLSSYGVYNDDNEELVQGLSAYKSNKCQREQEPVQVAPKRKRSSSLLSSSTGASNTTTTSDLFPHKLYRMLQEIEESNNGKTKSIVRWVLPHGKCFRIFDKNTFTKNILPKYFSRITKIKSFERQLQKYGFVRIKSGSDRGAWFNVEFIRGQPHQLDNIERIELRGDQHNRSSKCTDEMYYKALKKPTGKRRTKVVPDACFIVREDSDSFLSTATEAAKIAEQPCPAFIPVYLVTMKVTDFCLVNGCVSDEMATIGIYTSKEYAIHAAQMAFEEKACGYFINGCYTDEALYEFERAESHVEAFMSNKENDDAVTNNNNTTKIYHIRDYGEKEIIASITTMTIDATASVTATHSLGDNRIERQRMIEELKDPTINMSNVVVEECSSVDESEAAEIDTDDEVEDSSYDISSDTGTCDEAGNAIDEEEDQSRDGSAASIRSKFTEPKPKQIRKKAKHAKVEFKRKKKNKKPSTGGLPVSAVQYLKDWMMSPEHINHPYPNEEEKLEIIAATGITKKQMSNWFVNNRKRIWKPHIEALVQGQRKNAK